MFYRFLVRLVLFVLAPFYGVTLGRREGSPSRKQRMGFVSALADTKRLWIHSVSLGEANLAKTIWEHLDHWQQGFEGLWTATTPTGLGLAKGATKGISRSIEVVPFPLDHPGAIKRFLNATKPSVLILVETEIWPELLRQCKLQNIPAAVVNGRISDRAMKRFKRFSWALGPAFKALAMVSTRGKKDQERFVELGVAKTKVEVGGDLKWDLAISEDDQKHLKTLMETYHIHAGETILVAGSTRPGEEKMILNAFVKLRINGHRPRLVIAPRHLERAREVAELLRGYDFNSERASIFHRPDAWQVLLLDTAGELRALYGCATLALMGGTFEPFGGHNPLEALAWGKPLVCGPHGSNFRDILDTSIKARAIIQVEQEQDLSAVLATLLDQETARKELSDNSQLLIQANAGAVKKACDMIGRLLGVAKGHED